MAEKDIFNEVHAFTRFRSLPLIRKSHAKLNLIALMAFSLGHPEKDPIGSGSNPTCKTMYVLSDDAQGIMESSSHLIKFLEKSISQLLYGKDEGFYFTASVPNSYIAVVEAFGTR
ncbi:MAG: hypothetical protein R2827_08985 [Bdellovibrionales bacterium]